MSNSQIEHCVETLIIGYANGQETGDLEQAVFSSALEAAMSFLEDNKEACAAIAQAALDAGEVDLECDLSMESRDALAHHANLKTEKKQANSNVMSSDLSDGMMSAQRNR